MLQITSLRVTVVPTENVAQAEAFVTWVEWFGSAHLYVVGPVSRSAANVLADTISRTIDETNRVVPVS